VSSGVPFDHLPETVGSVAHGKPFTVGAEDNGLFHRATWLDKAYPEGDVEEFPEEIVERNARPSSSSHVAGLGVS